MTAKIFQSLPSRPAPTRQDGLLGWLRANLFGDLRTSLATVLIGGLLLWLLPQFLQWAVFSAVWRPNFDACRADGVGGQLGREFVVHGCRRLGPIQPRGVASRRGPAGDRFAVVGRARGS